MGQPQHDQFGDLLRTLRRRGGLTQEELSERSGSSVRSIREMERGRVRSPQRRTATLLADALGLDGADRTDFLAAARTERIPPDGTPATVVPGELPSAVPDLAGRGAELAVLRTVVADLAAGRTGTAGLVVLHGPPGIGKTSLTVAAGHLLSPSFPDGQLFVDLAGAVVDSGGGAQAAAGDGPAAAGGGPAAAGGGVQATAGNGPAAAPERGRVHPAEALAGLLRSLGLPDARLPVPPAERSGLFRTLTRDRRLLLVLDNAADEGQVRPLLPAGQHCLVLVTSRRPLTGLTGAVRVPLGVLEPEPGRELLASILGAGRVAAEPAAAEQLVRLCGRLPLALRIAGNRLAGRPQWSVARLVGQLRDQRRRLTVLTAGDLDVRAAFEVSYRQLDPLTAAVFRRASLIPGADFDAGLVAAAAGCDEESAAQAAEDLVDAGLLLSLGDRYQFHDLVRLYAHERLAGDDPPERRSAAHDRMVGWLLRRTEQAGAMFSPGACRKGNPFDDDREAAAWLDRESGNWPAALRDAARQGWHADVVRVARALHWYSDAATHRHSWDEVFSLGVTAARALGSARDEAVLLNFLGWARYYCRERNSDGLAALEQALELARRIGDRREEAWALAYSASIFIRSGRALHAVDSARQAVGLFRQVGYLLGEACAANVQGSALAALGRFPEAAELHREVLEFYRGECGLSSTGALIAQGATMMALGADLAGAGDWPAAVAEYARTRALFRRCRAAFAEASAAYQQGMALRELGAYDAAADELRQALALFAGVPSPWWEARTLHALAALAGVGPVGAADARRLRRRALDRCGELDAPEARQLRATLLRELAE
ncbi:ATP-binding protein [Plantactinospora sp. WMMC1484]|uniref:ATP-binding protein n=1 Tax=Plantactinospora sp. WMMC1484 TaxID=3404122 RepID=UPI003BF60D05